MSYNFIIKGKWGRGKDCLLWVDSKFTSLATLSYPTRECLTLWSQTRTIIAFIQISRRVVIFFFHLMTWGISSTFIYGFIVKQACFVPWHSDSFLVWVCALSLSHVQLFATPWTVSLQVPLSVEFSRQEYWSGLPFSPPGDLPNPGIKLGSLRSPALAGGFFTTVPATWEAPQITG